MGYEFSDVRFSREECLEAANYIVKERGVSDQNSVRAYTEGDMRIERTNTNDLEVTINGKVVMSAPPPGSSKQVIWEPDDWLYEVFNIKDKIEHTVCVDKREDVARRRVLRRVHLRSLSRKGGFRSRD